MDEITNWFVLCFDASELAFWEKSRNDQIKMRGGMLRPQLFWPRDRLANPGQPLITLEKCLFLSQLMSANVWLSLSEIGHKEGCHRVCISFLTDSQPLSSWAVFAENSASSIQIINREGGKYFFTALEIRGHPVKSVWLLIPHPPGPDMNSKHNLFSEEHTASQRNWGKPACPHSCSYLSIVAQWNVYSEF